MRANQSDVQAFLEGSKQFALPLYQRRYSWSHKHWTTLAHDLERLISEPERRSHFIGAFVAVPLDHAADQSVSRYRLIDGQQRLTTLLLLLAALRDVAAERGEAELAAEVHGLYLTNQYKRGDAAKKLLLTEEDQPDFAAAMLKPAAPAGRIGGAYQFFATRLRAMPAGQLGRARDAALGRLTVVSITLAGDDDPHLIFESLNAKGERLTQADLLRNYFLMRLPQAEADAEFRRLWQPMQRELDADLTNFFRHYLMRDADGAQVLKDEVYDRVKERIDRDAPTARDVVRTLGEIRRYAADYARLVAPDVHELDADTALRVRRLHSLKVTTSYPFLMNVMAAVATGRMAEETFPATLDLVEAFLVRRLACGIPTNQLRVIFRGLCREAAEAVDSAAFLLAVRATLSQNQRCPNDAAFRDAIARRPLYGGSQRDAARYMLNRIEQSYDHREPPDPTADRVEVEHVMPQTLTDAWRVELSPDEPQIAEEVHAQWLHTLGNLTLTGFNAPLGNKPYGEKKSFYAESNFTLNAYFANVAQWDADAIAARGNALADQAIVIWPDVSIGRVVAAGGRLRTPTGRLRPLAPVAVLVDGTRIEVGSMLDAAHRAFQTLHARDPARFSRALAAAMPPRRCGPSEANMRTPRPVGDQFVDLHGSGESLQNRCRKLVAAMGLPPATVTFELPAPMSEMSVTNCREPDAGHGRGRPWS